MKVFYPILVIVLSVVIGFCIGSGLAQYLQKPHTSKLEEYTQRYMIGDYLVGNFPTGIAYHGYNISTNTISFWDDIANKPIRVANIKSTVILCADRSFSISSITFIKCDDYGNYVLECSVHVLFDDVKHN